MTHRFSFGFLAVLMLLCAVLAGCGSQQASAPKEERVVTDTAGREVHLPGEVKSIAVVPIPWASVAFAVDGSADRIAGMHPSAKASYEKSMLKVLAPEMANATTDFVGQDFSIHMEELGKLNPSAIIVWNYQKDEIAQLENLKIPTIALKLRYVGGCSAGHPRHRSGVRQGGTCRGACSLSAGHHGVF